MDYNAYITYEREVERVFKVYLDAVRVNAKMKQREWAESLGVTVNTVINWEKGETEPSLSQLREMSRLSGIPMDFIYVPEKSN